jgi:hypothetical protein
MSFVEDTNQVFIIHGENVSSKWKVSLEQNIKISNHGEKFIPTYMCF